MEDLLNTINTTLSQQPWWVIALGTAFLMLVFRRRSTPPTHCSHHTSHTIDHHKIGGHKIGGTSVSSASTTATFSEFKFDGATVEELRSLIQKGDKIAAIKLVRQKTGIDLAGAKTMVEALELKK